MRVVTLWYLRICKYRWSRYACCIYVSTVWYGTSHDLETRHSQEDPLFYCAVQWLTLQLSGPEKLKDELFQSDKHRSANLVSRKLLVSHCSANKWVSLSEFWSEN